ncbi:unnamed protein product [Brassica napus]|uniref:(rape) hypothetical protein n=1 Tax=Brassica napus TaxID=3708 RepID=A0A816VWR3_BRANA|nr:unnamed protein product [Brassica napus]
MENGIFSTGVGANHGFHFPPRPSKNASSVRIFLQTIIFPNLKCSLIDSYDHPGIHCLFLLSSSISLSSAISTHVELKIQTSQLYKT